MSEIFRTILIMSLSGSIVALLLMILKPLYKNRLQQSFQYYLWMVVLAVLLLPVSALIQVPGDSDIPVFQPILYDIVTQNVRTSDELAKLNTFAPMDGAIGESGQLSQTGQFDQLGRSNQMGQLGQSDLLAQGGTLDQIEQDRQIEQPGQWVQNLSFILIETMIVIYPIGAILVILTNFLTYQVFCARLKRNSLLTSIPSPIPIYQSNLAQTPMLVGIFRPRIVLPKRELTSFQLKGVLRHEMVHFRRKDILIKWLSVLTCAVHWFNPIVWLTRREISRACELSCDEAVITGLDAAGRQMYGDTLILVAADDRSMRPTLAMGEDKRELKERLANIMKRKKHTKVAVTILVLLLVISAAAVTILGARSREAAALGQTEPSLPEQNQILDESVKLDTSITDAALPEESTQSESIEPQGESDDLLPRTKNITIWVEGIPEESPVYLATSRRYNFGIYLPFNYEFSEMPGGDVIEHAAASALNQECSIMIRPMEADETVPEDGQEGDISTKYWTVELPEMTLLISSRSSALFEEGNEARMKLIADTIFDLSPYQVPEEEPVLLSKRMEEFRILEARINAFYMEYFDGDSAALRKSLSSAYQGDITVYPILNTDLLVIGHVRGLYEQFEAIPDLDRIEVSLEYKDSVLDDSFQNLTIELVREGVDWKVTSYGVER